MGFMVGIDLGEHDPGLRIGHLVALEARRRGAIVRPLGETIVLMPPLSISAAELRCLVAIVGESIEAALAAPAHTVRARRAAQLPQAA
jgi:adenosylmethionine-8-amino-7-oxononanoate aminotransferase